MVNEVTESIKKTLEKWTSRVGKTLDELLEEYKECFEIAQKENPDASIEAIRANAKSSLYLRYKRKYGDVARSKAELFEGFIEGGFLENRVMTLTRIALAEYKKNPEVAKERSLTDEDGVPLDPRSVLDGSPNPNYLKPLSQAKPYYIRTIFGVGKRIDRDFGPFVMTAWRDLAEKITYKTFTPCEFRAISKAGAQSYNLTASSVTVFHRIERDWNMEEMMRRHHKIEPLTEVANYAKHRPSDRIIWTEARIRDLRLEPSSVTGNRTIILDEDEAWELEDGIPTFVPPSIPVNFGEDSKVIVLGRAGVSRDRPILEAYGIYPIPGHSTYMGTKRFTQSEIVERWIE